MNKKLMVLLFAVVVSPVSQTFAANQASGEPVAQELRDAEPVAQKLKAAKDEGVFAKVGYGVNQWVWGTEYQVGGKDDKNEKGESLEGKYLVDGDGNRMYVEVEKDGEKQKMTYSGRYIAYSIPSCIVVAVATYIAIKGYKCGDYQKIKNVIKACIFMGEEGALREFWESDKDLVFAVYTGLLALGVISVNGICHFVSWLGKKDDAKDDNEKQDPKKTETETETTDAEQS